MVEPALMELVSFLAAVSWYWLANNLLHLIYSFIQCCIVNILACYQIVTDYIFNINMMSPFPSFQISVIANASLFY